MNEHQKSIAKRQVSIRDKFDYAITIAIFGIIILFSFNLNLYAQGIGELEIRLKENNLSDSLRAAMHEELAWLYLHVDKEKLLFHALLAKKYSLACSDSFIYSSSLNRLGDYYFKTGKYHQAIRNYKQSYKIRDALKLLDHAAGSLLNMSSAYSRLDQEDSAIFYLEKARQYYIEIGNNYKITLANIHLVISYCDKGNLKNARELLVSLDSLIFKYGFETLKSEYFKAKATYSFSIGRYKSALFLINKSIIEAGNQNYEESVFRLKMFRCGVYNELGFLDSAIYDYTALLNVKELAYNKTTKFKVFANFGITLLEKGELIKSEVFLKKALILSKQHAQNLNVQTFYKAYADLMLDLNQVDSAIHYYNSALGNTDISIYNVASIHNSLNKIYRSKNDFENAHLHLLEFKKLNDSLIRQQNRTIEYELKYEKLLVETNLYNQKLENVRVNETLKKRNMTIFISISTSLIIVLIILAFYLKENNKRQLIEHEKFVANQRIDELLKTQELKSIQKVLEIQEEERTRIAQDLHDRLGGMIATTRLLFDDLQYSIAEIQINSSNTYQKAMKILEDAGNEVRNVAHNLANSTLKSGGLKTAINELSINISSAASIDFNFIYTGENIRFHAKFESYIYRIVQELVSNTLKHASAKTIDLNLTIANNELTMIYEDNGIGFEKGKIKYGIGLQGIEKRLSCFQHCSTQARFSGLIAVFGLYWGLGFESL